MTVLVVVLDRNTHIVRLVLAITFIYCIFGCHLLHFQIATNNIIEIHSDPNDDDSMRELYGINRWPAHPSCLIISKQGRRFT